MLAITMGKKVALGALTAVFLTASVLFFITRPAIAQSGVEKSQSARNITLGQNAESVPARPGDIIEYRLQVRSTENGSRPITIETDIRDLNPLSDLLSVSDNGDRLNDTLRWRDVQIGSEQTIVRTFRIRIKEVRYIRQTADRVMANTFGNTLNIRVVADEGTNMGTERSKTAYNNSQGRSAQEAPARTGDIITYTLTYRNQTDSVQTITIEDDLTDVLYLSDITNMGGGQMSGSTIRFENIAVPGRARVDRTFEVRVKSVPAGTQDTLMSNFYGNGIDIKVETQAPPVKGQPQAPQTPYKAPSSGVSENVAAVLAGAVTFGAYIIQRRKKMLVS